MKTSDAIKFFGSIKRLAQKLDVYPQAIGAWGDYPPIPRQYQIEVISGGELRAERKNEHDDSASY